MVDKTPDREVQSQRSEVLQDTEKQPAEFRIFSSLIERPSLPASRHDSSGMLMAKNN